MNKRKILYVTGTRADYGLMRSVLENIKQHPLLELEIVATGMHLMKEFGYTIHEVESEGYKINRINVTYEKDDKESMAIFIGKFIQKFAEKIRDIKPDIIMVLGDRGEMLGTAIVGSYLSIPVAHIHGGEITSTVDEFTRHAITKLSHIHFPATKKSAERIIKIGEDPNRIFIIGAPGLDSILNHTFHSKEEICNLLDLDTKEPILIIVQHPVTIYAEVSNKQMRETLEAIKDLEKQTIVIYPNADAGGRKIIKVIQEYKKFPFIHIIKNLEHDNYLSLMKNADVLIGNSSSGIIEAPSFYLPVVNIGTRQEGRERAENVIDVDHNKDEIIKAIEKALYNEEFKDKVKKCKNPYGDGKAGERIAKILSKIEINNKLLQKKLSY
ncbi:UDP-N-acetyl-D-glucosamine 2-epimerase, UDP-hydrolysing [groundwater metagenome]|uniref:UDP-N-acetyl-D-glucosamine 2-epimerase, UDP-hydrolysing n=1 Tax=groundwater metagenome TaxID=717931 RepID=A0A098EA70_9ZZZZ